MADLKGFIVADKIGALELGSYNDTPKGGVLVHGNKTTVFVHRNSAQRAIQRTLKYAEANKLDWGNSHRIYTLISHQSFKDENQC